MRGLELFYKKGLKSLLVLLFWLGVWQILHWMVGREVYIPSPKNVLITLGELVFLPRFWESVGASIVRVLAGLFLSIFVGSFFGVLAGINKHIYDLLYPLVLVIKSTPVLSFIIIALIWFSSSSVPIFIGFLMCFPVIWTNVSTSIHQVDKNLLEMARSYGVPKWRVYKNIYFPSIFPYFLAGCITCLGLGWKVTVAAEVLSHPRNSIGSNLYSAKVYLDSSELFAWTLVVILLSLFFESVFAKTIRKMNLMKGTQ
jgi:NitT/TauT family transport system permease protein